MAIFDSSLAGYGSLFDISYMGPLNPVALLQFVPFVQSSPVIYFKMRALAFPGPGYVTWVAPTAPDATGTFAPAAIQSGTAVASSTWEVDTTKVFSTLPEDKALATVSGPSVLVNPNGGLLFLGVDTSQVTWNDLDTVTLPNPAGPGSQIALKDVGAQANVKRITVSGNGFDIDGQPSQLIDTIQGSLHLIFNGSQWSIV